MKEKLQTVRFARKTRGRSTYMKLKLGIAKREVPKTKYGFHFDNLQKVLSQSKV